MTVSAQKFKMRRVALSHTAAVCAKLKVKSKLITKVIYGERHRGCVNSPYYFGYVCGQFTAKFCSKDSKTSRLSLFWLPFRGQHKVSWYINQSFSVDILFHHTVIWGWSWYIKCL
jgi:hypothetical protein